jgi:hypothetical protein
MRGSSDPDACVGSALDCEGDATDGGIDACLAAHADAKHITQSAPKTFIRCCIECDGETVLLPVLRFNLAVASACILASPPPMKDGLGGLGPGALS